MAYASTRVTLFSPSPCAGTWWGNTPSSSARTGSSSKRWSTSCSSSCTRRTRACRWGGGALHTCPAVMREDGFCVQEPATEPLAAQASSRLCHFPAPCFDPALPDPTFSSHRTWRATPSSRSATSAAGSSWCCRWGAMGFTGYRYAVLNLFLTPSLLPYPMRVARQMGETAAASAHQHDLVRAVLPAPPLTPPTPVAPRRSRSASRSSASCSTG